MIPASKSVMKLVVFGEWKRKLKLLNLDSELMFHVLGVFQREKVLCAMPWTQCSLWNETTRQEKFIVIQAFVLVWHSNSCPFPYFFSNALAFQMYSININGNSSDASALQHARTVNVHFSFFSPCIWDYHNVKLGAIGKRTPILLVFTRPLGNERLSFARSSESTSEADWIYKPAPLPWNQQNFRPIPDCHPDNQPLENFKEILLPSERCTLACSSSFVAKSLSKGRLTGMLQELDLKSKFEELFWVLDK